MPTLRPGCQVVPRWRAMILPGMTCPPNHDRYAMNRLLFCEPWPVSNLTVSLDQFLDGIISLFITLQFLTDALHLLSLLPLAAVFFAGAFLASGLARGFAAGFAVFLATAFLAGAFFFAVFFGASASSPSAGAAATGFSFFGRGPTVGCLLSVRISVTRSTVISSR